MVWSCMSTANSAKLQLTEGTMSANTLTQRMIPSLVKLGLRAVLIDLQDDQCLAKEAEVEGDGVAKHVSRPKPNGVSVGHPKREGGGEQSL